MAQQNSDQNSEAVFLAVFFGSWPFLVWKDRFLGWIRVYSNTQCRVVVVQRCVPVSCIVAEEEGLARSPGKRRAVQPGERPCPACRLSPVLSFRLLPMSIDVLDQAVALRKEEAAESQAKHASQGTQDGVKFKFAEAQAEASYLLLAHGSGGGGGGSMSAENDYQRTGRWTDDEVVYTDFLVEAFDSGKLPIEHGMKLSDFLSEVLLCKSSRLTKKMKNAKLSVRSYETGYPFSNLDTATFSMLEQKFLGSISSEPSRLELSFNLTRLWRCHFSNLCLQVGSTLLDASDWIASLEDMERHATMAEERIRKARRKRMGLALKKDVDVGRDGVFFSGVPMQRPPKRAKEEFGDTYPAHIRSGSISVTDASSTAHSDVGDSEEGSDMDFVREMMDLEDQNYPQEVDDYARILDDLVNGPGIPTGAKHMRNNCGPFLEEIISYVESNNLPFQHVDVWVPSYTKNSEGEDLRLFHAGFATRSDVEGALFGQMNEYGEYSTKFSFASGAGLPGRVHASGGFRWERGCHVADPKFFERAGGAKIYGVKTGFGLPLSTKVIGRIILCFYSVEDVPEDSLLANKCCADLSRLCPEPKWKLVVDMETPNGLVPTPQPVVSFSQPLSHYQHAPAPLGRGDDLSLNSASTRRSMSIDEDAVTDHRIASLLGDHMPLSGLPAPGESTSSSAEPSLLVPHFMSLRLLLLRSTHRRSQAENDMIDVVRKSFAGYTRDGRRSDKELAHLIVKDWQFLRQSQPVSPKNSPGVAPKRIIRRSSSSNMSNGTYQSHVMDIPLSMNPPPQSDAAPVTMPSPLTYVDPHVVRRASFGS